MKKKIGMLVWGVLTGISVYTAYNVYITPVGQAMGSIANIFNTWIPIPVLGMPLYYIPIWTSIGLVTGYILRGK